MSYVFERVRVPADRSRIGILDPVEVKWWSSLFGCSAAQLRDAVAQVGDSAAEVERLLDEPLHAGWVPVRAGAAGAASVR
jgi:hypothetical protein